MQTYVKMKLNMATGFRNMLAFYTLLAFLCRVAILFSESCWYSRLSLRNCDFNCCIVSECFDLSFITSFSRFLMVLSCSVWSFYRKKVRQMLQLCLWQTALWGKFFYSWSHCVLFFPGIVWFVQPDCVKIHTFYGLCTQYIYISAVWYK